MLSNVIAILPVFLILLVGFGAGKIGFLGDGAATFLNRFVVWIPLPCLLFDVVATTDWARLWHPGFVAVSLIGSLIAFAMGLMIGRLRGLSIADMGVEGMNASYSNVVYIGLPLLTLTLGSASRPYLVVAGTLTLTTLFMAGVALIEFGSSRAPGSRKGGWRTLLGMLGGMARNPVIVSPLAGLIFWLTGWHLPAPLHQFMTMLGGVSSPVALVAVGLFLAQRPILQTVRKPAIHALALIKLVVHPVVTAWLAWRVFALPSDVAIIAIAIAALPTGTGPFMIAELYVRDARVTSGTIIVTTLASVMTIAAVLALLQP
ncbi:MAG: AEC family transporter [Sphingobium sp.]|uniref:AEC family transporter n=1 Tax=Sphingobium sp. TaxID=1912891 RepID=UPI0029B7EB11|nr:AEC family transporter [Sphingobium sp.]MDX3909126.1 AEC family transporter [Sphingobium sp.]